MRRTDFEDLVRQALDSFPPFFLNRLDNIDVVVEDWPTPADLDSVGLRPGQALFGLYQGIPLTQRATSYGLVAPDRIVIYRGPIELACRNDDEIRDQVRHTVIHEIAHFFGISDARLRELGAY